MKLLLSLCLLSTLAISGFGQALTPYLTPHFTAWLNKNGYQSFNFERTDIANGGSFGGKADDKDTIVNEPVIFFHGNSDQAIGDPNAEFNGFTNTIQYLLTQGYKESEIYVTTWGPANPSLASQQTHSYEYLNYLRNFVEAVLKYTKAKKIDIIAHSMGVTLGRKVIRGGSYTDGTTQYNLGDSLVDKVDTFLGIAGGNLGLVACYLATSVPTCNKNTGFYPGIAAGPINLSKYLSDLLTNEIKEGDHLFSMLSTADDLIGFGDIVWGKYTSEIKNSDATKIYSDKTHMQLKSATCEEQLQIITKHTL